MLISMRILWLGEEAEQPTSNSEEETCETHDDNNADDNIENENIENQEIKN